MVKLKSSKNIKEFEKGPLRRSLFTNGAVSLFHEMKHVHSAVVNLYFLAGSVFESEKEYGIAHVIEHMLFKEGGKSELVKELEFHGASINAYTYKEYVCFEMYCLSTKVEEFLPKFLTLFLNPLFNLKELILEKNVISQEIKEDKDDHQTEGFEYIFSKNFNKKIGHSIGGSIKSVKSFKKSDLEKYYNKYFAPNRLILSVSSGSKLNKLEDILLDVFNQSSRMERVLKPFRLGHADKICKVNHFKTKLKRKTESSILMLSFAGVTLESRYFYDLLILDELLFEGLSSKFFVLLREELGLIYGLGSSINSFVRDGNYVMVFNTSKKNIKAVKDAALSFLDKFSKETFKEQEVRAVVDRVISGWKMSFDDPQERCEYFAMEEIYGTYNYSIRKMENELQKVNSKSIKQLLNKILKYGHSELVIGQ